MSAEADALYRELELLSQAPGGRRLLQLALRGLESGEHRTCAARWRGRRGSGSLLQIAYWQGVAEHAFPRRFRAEPTIRRQLGVQHRLASAIAADAARLAAGSYTSRSRGAFGLPRRRFDERAYRERLAGLVIDVLAGGPAPHRVDLPGAHDSRS